MERFLRALPIFGLAAIVAYFCYVFIYLLSAQTLVVDRGDKVQGGLYIAFFGLCLLLLVPTYVRVVWPRRFGPRGVAVSPADFGASRLRVAETDDEEDRVARLNPLSFQSTCFIDDASNGSSNNNSSEVIVLPLNEGVRFCVLCQCLKPVRTHHCSKCKECVLKMDHHCVWLSTCIGHANYKFFLVFLAWSLAGCGFCFGVMLQEVIWEGARGGGLSGRSAQFIVVLVVAGVLGMACLSLLLYHLGLLVPQNMSTVEHMEWQDCKRDRAVPDELRFIPEMVAAGADTRRRLRLVRLANRPFNVGVWRNWRQVFGPNPLLWFLPIWTSQGSGLRFPIQKRMRSTRLPR